MKIRLLIFAFLLGFLSFSQNELPKNINGQNLKLSENNLHLDKNDYPFGICYSLSEVAVQGAYNQLKNKLKKNEAISIIAEIDHSENAKSINEELGYIKLIFFGNPVLGTPLMQKNQLAGIDLPQKVLFYKNENKDNLIIYNSVDYLKSRHDLEGVKTLSKMSRALENLISGVSKSDVQESGWVSVSFKEGIITKKSKLSFEETYTRLKNTLVENPKISIMAELDHRENAARVGLELQPTRILVFGTPELGTPLMQKEASIGLDLPQKMLVWENEEGVFVSYNDPFSIAKRHSVENNEEVLRKISGALESISNAAIGN